MLAGGCRLSPSMKVQPRSVGQGRGHGGLAGARDAHDHHVARCRAGVAARCGHRLAARVLLVSTAHSTVLAEVGPRIVRGDLAEGSVITLDWLGDAYGVSRTVAREVVQVLVSMGLVESRRRTGIRILPREEWDDYDPAVIRWRLEGEDRVLHLHQLAELRAADRAGLGRPRGTARRTRPACRDRAHRRADGGLRLGRRPADLPRAGRRLPPAAAAGLGQRDVLRARRRGRGGAARAHRPRPDAARAQARRPVGCTRSSPRRSPGERSRWRDRP